MCESLTMNRLALVRLILQLSQPLNLKRSALLIEYVQEEILYMMKNESVTIEDAPNFQSTQLLFI